MAFAPSELYQQHLFDDSLWLFGPAKRLLQSTLQRACFEHLSLPSPQWAPIFESGPNLSCLFALQRSLPPAYSLPPTAQQRSPPLLVS